MLVRDEFRENVERGDLAAVKARVARSRFLVKHHIGGYPPGTALSAACRAGQLRMVQYLLSEGAALKNGTIQGAAEHGHDAIVKLLLDQVGDDVDVHREDLGSSLITAAERRHVAVVKTLVVHPSCDLEYQPTWRSRGTALAIACAENYPEIAWMLLCAGADWLAEDTEGLTPEEAADRAPGGSYEVVKVGQGAGPGGGAFSRPHA